MIRKGKEILGERACAWLLYYDILAPVGIEKVLRGYDILWVRSG